MFHLVLVVILTVVYGYPAWRLLGDLALSPEAAGIAALAVALLGALPVLHVLVLRTAHGPGPWRRLLSWVVFLELGVAVVLFDVVLARDLLWLLARIAEALSGAVLLPADAATLSAWRRQSAGACLAATLLLVARGLYNAHRTPAVRHVDIPIPDLPAGLEGLRIAHLTDLHVSHLVRRPFVERVAEAVADLRPDLVVFTGDLADGHVDDLGAQVTPLGRLQPPLGAWFSTGNHDYFHDAARWLERMAGLGYRVVANGHGTVAVGDTRLVIGGLPDPAGAGHTRHTPRVEAVFADAPAGVRLLLVHQPRLAVTAAASTCADLTLSGHTHGGQLWPWSILVRWQQGLVSGLHRATGDGGWLYVSRGLGTWGPPLRLGADAEIACLTLRRA